MSVLMTIATGMQAQFETYPCSKTTNYSGGKLIANNGNYDAGNGYNCELWSDRSYSGTMTVFGGDAACAFKASWTNASDFMARIGYYDSSHRKTYSELGNIIAEFNETKSGSAGSEYSYIGVYGWFANPAVEYYIVDDTFHPNMDFSSWGYMVSGSYELDDATYTLYKKIYTNLPNAFGTYNFTSYIAFRSTLRHCGRISVSEHFKKWEELTNTQLGKISESKILCEVGGGSGSIEFFYATMDWEGCTGIGLYAFDPDCINEIHPNTSNDDWHTLDGIKLQNKPNTEDIYIHGGKKVVIK